MMEGKVLGVEAIKELLPYRYPMLLIDRLWMEGPKKYVGLKNVTINEEFFIGHFPGHPVMPGVLRVEAMCQVAAIAAKPYLDPKGEGDIYPRLLERVKFRKPVTPGDRLMVEIEVEEVRDGAVVVKATNQTKSGVTCQANITMGVRPRNMEVAKPAIFNDSDKTESIVMDTMGIQKYIPHRYPFLLVDYIVSQDGPNVVAVKNISVNEPLMMGYSPDYYVLSSAAQTEIVAQAGCVHTLARSENQGKLAYYMGIGKAEFFRAVRPGDQLRIEVVLPEGKSRFGRGDGRILVDGEVVSTTEMTFALIDAEPAK